MSSTIDTKRRSFLKGAGLTAVGAAATTTIAAPAIAQSQPTVTWRMQSSFPNSLDTIYGTMETFARMVSEATDGNFTIQTFKPGDIVGGLQVLDAVSNGTIDAGHTPVYFYFGREPALGFGTGVPFGLNARQQHSWWHFGGGAEIINDVLAPMNVTSLACGNSGAQMGGFFRKEINSVADLEGLKFRIGGIGGQVMSRLGVVPQQIAPGDIYPALERGTIDAVEFVGPYDDEKLGFHQVAQYYYAPGFWEGGAMLHAIFNQASWDALPAHYKAIVRHAAEAANNWMLAKYDAVNPDALKRLVAAGAELRYFPQDVMEAALEAANAYYDETAAQNESFKRAWDSYREFRADSLLWWPVNELAFDNFMARTRGRG
ncbi:TRAP transporter substrate-binding protein DctP [Salinarimonas sp.]|uniref:TRAP transporter substrate-binding protein n=1 Tax=Salinarimonas sp. TaxID=2766526 RepID=UPI0032D8DA32